MLLTRVGVKVSNTSEDVVGSFQSSSQNTDSELLIGFWERLDRASRKTSLDALEPIYETGLRRCRCGGVGMTGLVLGVI